MQGHDVRSRLNNNGFTLIELMVVVVIIGILSSLLAANVMGRVEKTKESRALMDLDSIATASWMYKLDDEEGKWPQKIEDLNIYGIAPDTRDPWGGEYGISENDGKLIITDSREHTKTLTAETGP